MKEASLGSNNGFYFLDIDEMAWFADSIFPMQGTVAVVPSAESDSARNLRRPVADSAWDAGGVGSSESLA